MGFNKKLIRRYLQRPSVVILSIPIVVERMCSILSDYEKLYYMLFNKMTDLIEEMKTIQLRAEELCLPDEAVGKHQSANQGDTLIHT